MTRKACSVSRAAPADLIFNLTESHAGDDSKDVNVAAFLDLLEMRYTGSGPNGLHLGQDKALAKKILRPFSCATNPNARAATRTKDPGAGPREARRARAVVPLASGDPRGGARPGHRCATRCS
jgi:D-alanine-D-alanine ligase-like ATP-grasp enzyme